MGSLLTHVFAPITHVFIFLFNFLYSFFLSLFVCFVFYSFFLSFCFSVCYSPLFHCACLWPFILSMAFYTACRDKIFHFYPLTAFSLLWVSFQDYPLVCWLPNHHHYTVLAVPRLIPKPKWFCFFSYLP